jgi:hypothetical protein
VIVDPVDAIDALIRSGARRRGGGIRGVLPGEDHVVRSERPTVMPCHTALEAPLHPCAVGRHTAVGDARRLRGQDRHDRAFRIDVRERLVKQLRRLEVLRRHSQVRIQQRRRRPVQHAHRAASAAAGWRLGLGFGLGLGLCHAGRGEDLAGHRRGKPDAKHHLNEPTARQATALYLANELSDRVLVHVATSSSALGASRARPCGPRASVRTAFGAQENRPE